MIMFYFAKNMLNHIYVSLEGVQHLDVIYEQSTYMDRQHWTYYFSFPPHCLIASLGILCPTTVCIYYCIIQCRNILLKHSQNNKTSWTGFNLFRRAKIYVFCVYNLLVIFVISVRFHTVIKNITRCITMQIQIIAIHSECFKNQR